MRFLGVDGGIASIGWALVEWRQESWRIIGAGVRTFDAPETDKERTPKNALRRQYRGQRRVVRRRRQRMQRIRKLFAEQGLLATPDRDSLKQPGLDPWQLRAEGLSRRLTAVEWAVALGHIAKHRGFRSNSKRERGANAADESSQMLKAIAATQERLGAFQTVGEMFFRDPAFAKRKRNRGGDYSRSILRGDHEHEVRKLFAAQRRLGSDRATEQFEADFAREAFSQLPLQNSEHLVGECFLKPPEKRAPRRSYSFERFRLLARLAHMAIAEGRQRRALTPAQIALIADDFGAQKGITYKSVRRKLGLPDTARFADAGPEDEKNDIVARKGNAAEGTYALRQAVGGAWGALLLAPERLDRIAAILTYRDDLDDIRRGLVETGLEPVIVEAVMAAAEAGRFNAFSGTGHISSAAARAIMPFLAQGLVYSEACERAGFNHSARDAGAAIDLGTKDGRRAFKELRLELGEAIRNPVARKALTEMMKQVTAIIHEHGLPDRIHVELARDVGKSAEERDEITRGIEKRNKERDKSRARFTELLGRPPLNNDEMLRFELWEEQLGRCLYSDTEITPSQLAAADNLVQVDHILPWSRFGDDSFINKTLCFASANQAKRNRTPYEWFTEDKPASDWALFAARVEACKAMKGAKKRGFYLRQNAAEVEERFRSRNLGDTRYATRELLGALARLYPAGERHVLARPGALTAKLRQAWAVEGLKKDEAGKRLPDDRHHAVDALVLAVTTESMLQALTEAAKSAESRASPRGFDLRLVPEPWPHFRQAAKAMLGSITVSRAERHRARGAAHAATIRQVKQRDGKTIVYERKAVEALELKDLDRVKDAERNHRLIENVRAWIEAGKPKGTRPRSPQGDEIVKLRLETTGKPAVEIRGGTADRGDMARVDVFSQTDKKGKTKFHLVPIYPHQIADPQMLKAPDRAVVAFKDEAEWTVMDASCSFRFSLYQNSLIEVVKQDGEVIRGYFRGLDRATAAIGITPHENSQAKPDRPGSKTLLSFRKLSIDRLGRISEIAQETRTWRGEVCT